MNHQEIIDKIKPEFDKVIDFLKRELAKIRASRPSVSLVEDIEVECFNQKFLLKQLAALSISSGREILIQPWDKSYIEYIEKAISKSSLGMVPIAEGEMIRLSFPPLSTERREALLRIISQKREEARKTIRKWRREAWDKIQDLNQKGEISDDDKYRAKDKLQDLVDEYNEKIDDIVEAKRKEIIE